VPRGTARWGCGGPRRAAPAFFDNAEVWVWLNASYAATYDKNEKMRAATLPDDWYDRLPRAKNMTCAEERCTLRAALNDAVRAFGKLARERRAELLVPAPDPPKKKRSPKKPAQKKPAKKKRPEKG
jgi:hypothetical protein